MSPERLLQNFDRLIDTPDAVPRLRRFILDLAVRGKLVEQNPEDEPAWVLLKRIETEKARLEKVGTIRPSKSITLCDEPEHLFSLPKSWLWVRLGEVGSIIGGGTPPSKDSSCFTEGGKGVAWLTPADLGKHNSLFISHGQRDLTEKGLSNCSTQLMPTGSVLFTSRAPIGYIAIAVNKITTNQGFKSVVPYIIDSNRYIAVYFKAFAPWIDGKASGTTFKEVSGKIVSNIPFPLPPLAEQHRIVAKVDELMALCDELEAAQAKRERRRDRLVAATLHGLNNGEADLEAKEKFPFEESARFYFNHLPRLTNRPEHIQQLRQTILNLAVRGKLVPQDPKAEPASEMLARVREWNAEAVRKKLIRDPRKPLKTIALNESPYELPDGWAWARLGEVIYIQSGDGLTAENMQGGNIPVYGGNGINGYHDTFNIEEPTIVIGRVGYYCGSIHVTPAKAWVTDNAFITKYCSQEIFHDFLVLLLNGTNLKENENATAQPVISGSKIYPIVVGIPPLVEQHRIVAKVDELMALCDELETQITTISITRCQVLEARLYEALNGSAQLHAHVS